MTGQNIHCRDLFTNRFTRIALSEIICCRTFFSTTPAAFNAVLEDYVVLQQTIEEISDTKHGEYGQRANGVLSNLDKFDSVFGLKLGYLLFGAAEQLSTALQGKDATL